MAMKDFIKERLALMGWPEHKVMLGFCSTSVFCLLLVISLHVTTERQFSLLPCEDCKLWASSSSEDIDEHIRQVVADLSSKENSSLSATQQEEVVEVLQEWRLPSVTKDRPSEKLDDPEKYGEPRRFMPVGSGAFLFIQFSAYRGGSNTFAIVGLGTKALHKHGNPGFECSWISSGENSTVVEGNATKYYTDWGYGKQYTVLVINCTFDSDVGVDGQGGRLEMVANHGSSDHTGLPDVHFVALTEEPKKFDGSIYGPPYKYDYLYCGSPLFGHVSPQRIREWIAYHVWFLGPRSHFILYDAGGITDDVRKILLPWIKLGYISLVNVRQESRYDVYYYSQFLINADCIFKAKTLANWTFFFDVDEYVSVPSGMTLDQVMQYYNSLGRRAQQVLFKQNFMNHNHCQKSSLGKEDLLRQWEFEKLVYKRTQWTKEFGFPNRKYVIQAKYALTAGVHLAEHLLLPFNSTFKNVVIYEDYKLKYYHYHNTIDQRGELCNKFLDPKLKEMKFGTAAHVLDDGIAVMADAVRKFENRTVGQQPFLP